MAWIDNPSVLDQTVERVKEIRALGMDVAVDFHGRLHKGMAKQLAKLLEPHQPMFIEGSESPVSSILRLTSYQRTPSSHPNRRNS